MCWELLMLALLTTFVCTYRLYTIYNFWRQRNVKGPIPFPIFGNDIALFYKSCHPSELTKKFYDSYKREKVVGIFKWSRPYLIIRDQNLVKDVLIRHFSIFSDRGTNFHAMDALDQHIFNLPKSEWRPLRPALSSCFTDAKINSMFSELSRITDGFMLYLENEVEKSSVINICPVIFKYTTEIIGKYGFSLNMNELNGETTKFSSIHRRKWKPTLKNFIKRYLREIRIPYFLYILLHSRFYSRKDKSKQDFYVTLVKDIESYRRQENLRKDDFIGKLIDLPYDQENTNFIDKYYYMAAQVYVFFTAGSEGTAISLSRALYEIGNNETIQNKLRKEITEIKGMNMNDVKNLKYLDHVYKETLRKYPLRDIIRVNNVDYTFKDTNITIPKNTSIIIPHYAIHRDEKLYPNPDVFNPERFENPIKGVHYFPFGEGPRKCLGGKFASYIFKITLIKILQKFKISSATSSNQNDPWKVFLFPKDGIKVRFNQI